MRLQFSLPLVTQDQPGKAMVLMMVSVFFGSLSALMVKHLGETYPITQIAFFRSLFALFPLGLLLISTTGLQGLKTKRVKAHILRAFVGTASLITFFLSLTYLPLTDASTINLSGPLFVALFSILFLKEKVYVERLFALAVGFCGIILMAHSNSDDTSIIGAILGLSSAFFYGLSMIGLRSLGKTENAPTTVFYFSLLSALLLLVPAILEWHDGWQDQLLFFLVLGFTSSCSQILATRAFQYASASFVSPFTYTSLLWATLFGFLFWGDIPTVYVGIGATLIILSGFYLKRTTPTKFSWKKFFHRLPAPAPPERV